MAFLNKGSHQQRPASPTRKSVANTPHATRIRHAPTEPVRRPASPSRIRPTARADRAEMLAKRPASARVLPRHAPVGVQLARPMGRDALRKQRRMRLYGRTVVVIALIAMLVGGLSYVTHLDQLELHTVNVNGAQMLSASAVTAVVDTQLEGNVGGIFSKRSTFLYPQSAIEEELNETFPVIKSARVETQGLTGNELTVVVHERTPFALWCSGGDIGAAMGLSTACYVMDETGFVFASAFQANALGKGLLVYRGGIATSSDPIGSTVLPHNFTAVAVAVEAMRAIIPNPSELIIEGNTLSLRYNTGLTIRFTVTRAAEKDALIANLRSALESEALTGVPYENIEYIDLRFENRLYYKLRESL